MKAIMVMYDSLNRRMLSPYGCDWIPTPNFDRLARRSVTFDCNYVGSMPCMPARRELHTGRYNFEHRDWGPLEPFDDSMPEILKNRGIYTHLTTDHLHYWQDGGSTYHPRYSSCDLSRGQEGDNWKVTADLVRRSNEKKGPVSRREYDAANRVYLNCEERMPQNVTFRAGLDFIEECHGEDGWFLQIEAFDPHEPFFTQPEWQKPFADDYEGAIGDWPHYYYVTEGKEAVSHVRGLYAALITMCDHNLGKVLDLMDKYNLWEDTLLIVNTDHGYLLGEHDWWSKNVMPLYEEISHTPLFIHDPEFPEADGTRRSRLTQTIDLAPTILDFFGVEIPRDMEGRSLRAVIEKDEPVHDFALFGYHEGHCNITDGRYVYMKAPVREDLIYNYTLMPTHMDRFFPPEELAEFELREPFSFTKGCRVLKIHQQPFTNSAANFGTLLFDLQEDPHQENPIIDMKKETELANAMLRLMHRDDAPAERYALYGLPAEGEVSEEEIRRLREAEKTDGIPAGFVEFEWEKGAVNMYRVLTRFASDEEKAAVDDHLHGICDEDRQVGVEHMVRLIQETVPEEKREMVLYFAMLASRTY